jgi:hypothetical protein
MMAGLRRRRKEERGASQVSWRCGSGKRERKMTIDHLQTKTGAMEEG